MKKKELDSMIRGELNHIPRDIKRSTQNLVRLKYAVERRRRPDLPKETVLKAAIEAVKMQNLGFEPKYDKNFFNLMI